MLKMTEYKIKNIRIDILEVFIFGFFLFIKTIAHTGKKKTL